MIKNLSIKVRLHFLKYIFNGLFIQGIINRLAKIDDVKVVASYSNILFIYGAPRATNHSLIPYSKIHIRMVFSINILRIEFSDIEPSVELKNDLKVVQSDISLISGLIS